MSPSIPVRLLRTQSDARLVQLARAGHEPAFEALVHRYRKPLLGYCRRLLLPEARAEDALQQGLLQSWLALRAGCEVRDAKAWLYRIVHNAAVSALRRSGYDYVELDESLHGMRAPESDIDRRIAVREALAGLAALPEAQREVLLRTAVQGHSHEQVAAAMGLSDGAVRGLVYRARATLRAAATALMPPQATLWAARAAETGASHPQLAGIAGGAGSAGVFGLLLKAGGVVLSAGALATGAGLVAHGGGAATSAHADPAAGSPPAARVLSSRSLSDEAALARHPAEPRRHHEKSAGRAEGDHGPRTGRDAVGHDGHDGSHDALEGDSGGGGRGGPGPSGSGSSGDGQPSGHGTDGGSGPTSGSSSGPGVGGSAGGNDGSGSGDTAQRTPAPSSGDRAPTEALGADGGSGGGGGGSTSASSGTSDSSPGS